MTIRHARSWARKELQGFTPSLELDILVLLAHIFQTSTSFILAHDELLLAEKQTFFESLVLKRKTGMPIAYLTGIKEFWGLDFKVSPAVLIPKADTELLTERAISIIKEKFNSSDIVIETSLDQPSTAQDGTTSFKVLDVCTGSGCIAISLKHSCPHIDIDAFDISSPALTIAQENAETHVQGKINFYQQDLRIGLSQSKRATPMYDLIVSNPPYVPSKDALALLEDGRSEPLLALDGGTEGLDLIKPLIHHAYPLLKKGASILIETGEYNAHKTASLLKDAGFINVCIHKDLNNQDRVIEGTKP